MGTPKTPKPTNPIKTTRVQTPRPTPVKTPRPTSVVTPRPTTWTAPKTPKPTQVITPRPTNPVKTPQPTATYLATTPEPTEAQSGWGSGKPMSGCAKYTTQSKCAPACVWKSGYPPYSFSQDSKYQLMEEEFAMNGGFEISELLNNVDFEMFFGIGFLIAAVLVCAFRAYSMRKEKALDGSE